MHFTANYGLNFRGAICSPRLLRRATGIRTSD